MNPMFLSGPFKIYNQPRTVVILSFQRKYFYFEILIWGQASFVISVDNQNQQHWYIPLLSYNMFNWSIEYIYRFFLSKKHISMSNYGVNTNTPQCPITVWTGRNIFQCPIMVWTPKQMFQCPISVWYRELYEEW